MNDHPAKKLTDEYNSGIITTEYIKWELESLKNIYNDISFVKAFNREFPVYVIKGSKDIKFPFNALTENGKLYSVEEEMDFTNSEYFNDFKKIVGPKIHYPNLYGFTNCGFEFDEDNNICALNCIPRTYKETVYSCHILQYELWVAFQKIGKTRLATLDDLPMRKKIHEGKSNLDVILSGCNRSSLNDVAIAVIDYNERTCEYGVACATRTNDVSTYPGYYGFIPSGGFELYELEKNQDDYVIKENFSVISAVYREYIEELFGDVEFGKPTGNDDLNRLYRNEKIRNLINGVKKGSYKFEFLGIDFDLITLRQTLAFVLRIDDESFFYENEIKKNEENVYVRFDSLRMLEKYVVENNIPVMAETAGTYTLLKDNHLYKEIQENDFDLITN